MFKVIFRCFSLLFWSLAVLTLSVFDLFDDTLFFHSDPSNIFIFVASTALLFAIPITILLLPLLTKPKAAEILSSISLVIVLGNFVFFLVDVMFRQFNITVWLRDKKLESLTFLLYGIIQLAIGLVIYFHSQKRIYAQRVSSVAYLFTFFSVGTLLFIHTRGSLAAPPKQMKPVRVVMVVLDAWPGYLLHTFNPDAKTRDIDRIFQQGLVFRNVRTVTPWTNGYFGTVYSGSAEQNFKNWPSTLERWRNTFFHPQWNLFASLQNAGVRTRWIVWHNGGVPESKQVVAYRGFRSLFLTDQHAALLQAFHLDFNLLISSSALASITDSDRKRWLFNALNSKKSYRNTLTDLLLPEMRMMNADSNKSFLLFHIFWSAGETNIPAAWQNDERLSTDSKTGIRIVNEDYRYEPGDEAFIQSVRNFFHATMDSATTKIEEFLSAARREGLLENTILIITADHGEMADRGRLWYGYHPEEEVLRVPVVIFGRSLKGIDDRQLETEDLIRTVTDYLSARPGTDRSAVSLLGSGSRPFVASLTLKSDRHKEWFLVLYKNDSKYIVNIHPQSSGRISKYSVSAFHVIPEPLTGETYTEIKAELKASLLKFGISAGQIHPFYKELVR